MISWSMAVHRFLGCVLLGQAIEDLMTTFSVRLLPNSVWYYVLINVYPSAILHYTFSTPTKDSSWQAYPRHKPNGVGPMFNVP